MQKELIKSINLRLMFKHTKTLSLYNYPIIIYLIAFGLYFAPFPLNGSFTGDSDVFLHISLFREYLLNIKSSLGMLSYGHCFYPANGAGPFCDHMFGQAFIYMLSKLFGLSDVMASYNIVVAMFVLNAYAVNRLIFIRTGHKRAALLFGLMFSASCFLFNNIDFLNGISFFCIPLSLYFIEVYFKSKKSKFFYYSVVVLFIQSFFSSYYLIIGGFFWLVYYLVRVVKYKIAIPRRHVIFSVLVGFIFITPIFLKVISPEMKTAFNPITEDFFSMDYFVLKGSSFVSSLPRNIFYGGWSENMPIAFRANNGFVIYILLIVAVVKTKRRYWLWLILAMLYFLCSMGSYQFDVLNTRLPSLFKLLFDWNFLGGVFRSPYRFFTITWLIIILIGVNGYIYIEHKIKYKSVFAICIGLFFLLENIEYKVFVNSHELAKNIPSLTEDKFDKKELSVVANFPASLFSAHYRNMSGNENVRDYLYMYWQTFHRQNIINGSASYFSAARMANDSLMVNITEEDNLQELIKNNKLDVIIFHKHLIFNEAESNQLDYFRSNELLRLIDEDELQVFFEVH